MADDDSKGFRWRGFGFPTYTQIPDEFFDELMVHLNEAELRVLLYLMRRTFGFKKAEDRVSLKQLVEGIMTSEGRVLDHGTGMSKSAVQRGLKGLREKEVIVAERRRTLEHGDVATSYRVRMAGEQAVDIDLTPWSASGSGGGPLADQGDNRQRTRPVVRQRTTQETVEQETENGETDRIVDISKGRSRRINYPQTRIDLQPYAEDFAREFGDEAPQSSTLTRMVNLCDRSGQDVDEFIDVMLAARAKTKEFSGSVKAKSSDGKLGRKNRMPYFFAVLEEMLDLRRTGSEPGE
jgi:hypothetical protein